ncbi:MAG: ankyrin repeat domain-containing protein, partial [Gammaproteobacteria bacterium]|nr:ankyrin repeat domain-containing protein [Gammaproteobacteria bacterium]
QYQFLQASRIEKSYLSCLTVLQDGRVVSGNYSGTLRIWDLDNSECFEKTDGLEDELDNHLDTVRWLAPLSNGCIVSGYSNGVIEILEPPAPSLTAARIERILDALQATAPTSTLHILSLNGIELGELGLEHVLELIKTHVNLKEINLEDTRLTPEQQQILCTATIFRQSQGLPYIELKGLTLLESFKGNIKILSKSILTKSSLQESLKISVPKLVHLYAREGNTTELLKLIESDWSFLEYRDTEGNTPILLAVTYEHLETFRALIQAGADVTAANFDKQDAEQLAPEGSAVSNFLQHSKHLYWPDPQGNTPLHHACTQLNLNNVIQLLDKTVRASVYVQNKEGNTPLHSLLSSPLVVSKNMLPEQELTAHFIATRLVEEGSELNISNQYYQTPLSLSQKLENKDFRRLIEALLLANRRRFPSSWVSAQLNAALHQHGGDFEHFASDQRVLDHHVGRLIGMPFSKMMIEDLWVYIGHLHSLQGEFQTAPHSLKYKFEGFTINKALAFRSRTLFEMLICIHHGQLKKSFLSISKEEMLKKLTDELVLTLETLSAYQDQCLVDEEENRGGSELSLFQLRQAQVQNLASKINDLKEGENYIYPTGFAGNVIDKQCGHAVYMNIERQKIAEQDYLLFRVDNLGDGITSPNGALRHHFHADNSNRVYPAIFRIPRASFINNHGLYLDGLVRAKWMGKNEALTAIYDDLKKLPACVFLDAQQTAQQYSSRSLQTVGNCSVKNWQVGLQHRWQLIDPKHLLNPHELYTWFRGEEPCYLRAKYRKTAFQGTINSKSNAHAAMQLSEESIEKIQAIQDFVELKKPLKEKTNFFVNEELIETWPSLLQAAQAGNLEEVKRLVALPGYIEGRTTNGYTALHLAVLFNHTEVVDYLAQYEQLRTTKTSSHHQETPLDLARKLNQPSQIDRLFPNKMNINLETLLANIDMLESKVIQLKKENAQLRRYVNPPKKLQQSIHSQRLFSTASTQIDVAASGSWHYVESPVDNQFST